jgi:predicted AlkP superfamily phosphohydrolase/phosphomutase
VRRAYQVFDRIVGRTLERLSDDDLLVVMSDHGFTSWRRSFHLNTWLWKNGYLALSGSRPEGDAPFAGVDWSRTRAYALGINGLYLNLAGRERWGIVHPSEREALMDEVARKLAATVDPATGRPAVARVFPRERYGDRGQLDVGPDLIVAYAAGTRGSNESALGEVPPEVFADNEAAWSGDHCMDPDAVPGVLFASRPLAEPVEGIEDLAPAILARFGIAGSSR